MDTTFNQPVVIDNGTGVIKTGFAGEMEPRGFFPNFVGRTKHVPVMATRVEGNTFVGSKAEELRGLMKIKYPMEHGIINDWENMERVWAHIYGEDGLRIHSEDHPVLLTEAPLNPLKNRERAAEVFFETFNVPALFVSLQAILSLYASGRTTGLVLDSGDGVSHAVPIYEGFALPHSIRRMDVAGRDVTRHLQSLLRRDGHGFETSAELEIVRQIKESKCYITSDVESEVQRYLGLVKKARENSAGTDASGKTDGSAAESSSKYRSDDVVTDEGAYTLPDGNTIDVGTSMFKAPEALFNPDLVGSEARGVHHMIVDACMSADMDLRADLFGNIVLSGGSTLYKGFGNRLRDEIRKLGPKDTKIKIYAPQDRKFSTWVGGSILASLDSFKQMWVTSQQYEEYGANIINQKCF